MSKIEYEDRIEYHNKHNQKHRLNGPAVIYHTGKIEYWINNIQFPNKSEYQLYIKNFLK